MSHSPDVIVVGGGVIGCSVAYYTARRGLLPSSICPSEAARSASAGGLWPLGECLGLGRGVIFYKTLLAKGTVQEGANGPEQLPAVSSTSPSSRTQCSLRLPRSCVRRAEWTSSSNALHSFS